MRKLWIAILTLLNDEDGQALVEYVLALALAVGFVAILARAFRSSLRGLWTVIIGEISYGCPDCKSN